MAIRVACACGKTVSVKDELAGRRVKCPSCQQAISVPKPLKQPESADDERDWGDTADADFDDERPMDSKKSSGRKKSASRGAMSTRGKTTRKKTSGSNRGLLMGSSAGGGVLVVALLAWLLWPAKPALNVAAAPNNNVGSPSPTGGNATISKNTTGLTLGDTPNDVKTIGPPHSPNEFAKSQDEIRQSRGKLMVISQALGKNLPNDFTKGAYPAGYSDQEGTLILSWRVAILPALGENELFTQFRLDEPWDSEHNRQLIPKMPAVFKAVRSESKEGHTYYRGFAGADAMFPLKSPKVEKVQHGDRWCYPVSFKSSGIAVISFEC